MVPKILENHFKNLTWKPKIAGYLINKRKTSCGHIDKYLLF